MIVAYLYFIFVKCGANMEVTLACVSNGKGQFCGDLLFVLYIFDGSNILF